MHRVFRDRRQASDRGFTLVELMVVVLIIGVLVAIAVPVFSRARTIGQKKACFANQRTIEGVVVVWQSDTPDNQLADLTGVVNSSNPIIVVRILRPPHCPAAPAPADPMNPSVAEGAYTLNSTGTVLPCTFGTPVHGSFHP